MENSHVLSTVLIFWLSWAGYVFSCPTRDPDEGSGNGFGPVPPLPIPTNTTPVPFDGRCTRFSLPKLGLWFNGINFRRLSVCPNGLVRFRGRRFQPNPRNFGTYRNQRSFALLAPYWCNADLNSFETGDSQVFFYTVTVENQEENTELFDIAREYGKTLLNKDDYDPLWVGVVSWHNLRPNNPGDFEPKNCFDMLLANSVLDETIVVYRYVDITWAVKASSDNLANFQTASDLPVIGFRIGSLFQNYAGSGTVNVSNVNDFSGPLLGRPGQIGIVLNDGQSITLCNKWLNEQCREGRGALQCPLPCPPTYRKLRVTVGFDLRYRYRRDKDGSDCVFSTAFRVTPPYECCYDKVSGSLVHSRRPGASRAHMFHPRLNPANFFEEEAVYRSCCLESTDESCELFYSLRPPCRSRRWKRFQPDIASGFGDPHYLTNDGKNYTFNGCGWYTYLNGTIPGTADSNLVIQVRTTRVDDVNATGFTALAVKEGDAETVQVNLLSTGDFYVQTDQKRFNIQDDNQTILDSGVILSSVNKSFSILTPLGTRLEVRKAANNSLLTIVAAILPSYENNSLGLTGNWNGNVDDDFTLPNGTVLPIDMSESDIFYKFGEEWRVQEGKELYRNLTDDDNFKCPQNFAPVFFQEALDSLNSTLRAQAQMVCGNDLTCLFDIAATGNVALGESTLSESTEIQNDITILENNEPVFTENITVINVTLGETFVLRLDATDADGDPLTFDVPNLPPGATFNSTDNILYFSWNVISADETNITFLVQDTRNGSSTLSPSITLCRCVNGGECFVPEATSGETAAAISTFLVMSCNCPVGRTGEFCEAENDFCEGETTPPCFPLVTCTNNPTNFTCGPCPTGYEGDGITCTDINECSSNATNECDQMCINTDGSYLCTCGNGFSLDQNGKDCNDVDECTGANFCDQRCNNTIGSYECYCIIGFKINETDTTRCEALLECPRENVCSGDNVICYMDMLDPGVEKCTCRAGYELQEDQRSCADINECATTESNLCDQICTNVDGGYTCSCREGFVSSSDTACQDIDECLGGTVDCPGVEECENLVGGSMARCLCPERLNMVRVNGTCEFKDEDTVEDMADPPPSATQEQEDNSIEITLKNFQSESYTFNDDIQFKKSVVEIINDFCNVNTLRPQDCGVSQNKISFNELNVERLPGYPKNSGTNATLKFYVDYPEVVRTGSLPKTTLASIVFAKLESFQNATGYCIILNTPVTPDAPANPTDDQRDNAVVLQIIGFSEAQWTISYDSIFRRSVALSLTRYCDVIENDDYPRTQDCEFSGSVTGYNLTHVARLPGYPKDAASNIVNVSFYVTNPSTSTPVPRKVLASMLLTQESILENALSQQVVLQTFAGPDTPPVASSEQINNSVVIRISSFTREQWTYLNDRRLRRAISNRITNFCNQTSQRRLDCQITGDAVLFTETDVHRTSSATPSNVAGNSIDYSFYVNYPTQNVPIVGNILASIVKYELLRMHSESALFFSLETSFSPYATTPPTSAQSSNTVEIRIFNQSSTEWTAIKDNRFRNAIANQVGAFCSDYSVACVLNTRSDLTSFSPSNVIRIRSSPVHDGYHVIYTLFVVYPSDSGPIQQNLLAAILTIRLENIENESNMTLQIITSNLAPSPPDADSSKTDESVTMIAFNIQATQWSAIQDNKFRGYVAQAIVEYCTANDAQRDECDLPANDATFTQDHVQRVPSSPTENGDDSEIKFYVNYPGGGTMSKEILLLIMNEKTDSIAHNTEMALVLITPEFPTPPPATRSQNESAVSVVLKNFQVGEWPARDLLFRQNMAKEIHDFCSTSDFHRTLCNITNDDLNSLTSADIQRLPGSPSQNGTNSILKFYAQLTSGRIIPKTILATIFVERREKIFSLDSSLEDFTESFTSDETDLTPEQQQNTVPIAIINFLLSKFTSLRKMDIQVSVARRMNIFCFTTAADTCGITRPRRRKRAAADEFSDNDVIVTGVMAAGNDTVINVVVNEPGENNSVAANIVEEAMRESIETDNTSLITGLQLALVNTPEVITTNQRSNAVSVRLPNTQASEWQFEDEISFRENMSEAIKQFCGMSALHLDLCGLTSAQVNEIQPLNVRTLPESPSQNGTDTILSFFVDLPSGTTMPMDLLTTIFMSSPNILSQPNSVSSATSENVNPVLTDAETKNLVPLSIIIPANQDVRLDIQVSIAHRLNEHCKNNFNAEICPSSRNFTKDDIRVVIHRNNGSFDVSFVVTDPDTGSTLPVNQIQDAISGMFNSIIYGLPLTVSANVDEEDEDWPLIVGLSIVGAFMFLLVIVSAIYAMAVRSGKVQGKVNLSWRRSVYSGHSDGGWQFDRDSPYTGSPFSGIDGIPGFDDDGLPSNI